MAATLKVGETVQLAYVDQSRTLDADKTRVAGDLGRAGDDHGRQEGDQQRARISRASTSAAPISRRRSATSRAASATGCISRRRS